MSTSSSSCSHCPREDCAIHVYTACYADPCTVLERLCNRKRAGTARYLMELPSLRPSPLPPSPASNVLWGTDPCSRVQAKQQK